MLVLIPSSVSILRTIVPAGGCLLHAAQQHDRNEIADMQRRGRRIETDVDGHDLPCGKRVEAACIGDLVDIAPLVEQVQQAGRITGHDHTLEKRGALSMGNKP